MAVEIERKFLVNNNSFLETYSKCSKISQAYIFIEDNSVLRIRKIDDECIFSLKIGLNQITTSKIDYIISGINKGSNTSQNILYSGTIAAAVEGLFNKIPSFAFSITSIKPQNYNSAKLITRYIFKKFLEIFSISLLKTGIDGDGK